MLSQPRMIEKVVNDSATECQHSSSVLVNQNIQKAKPVQVRKKLVKKCIRKTHSTHPVNGKSKACSFDRLPNSSCKKAKINGRVSYISAQSENECDASSSVPSLASNFSGEGKEQELKISKLFYSLTILFLQS